MNAGERLWAYLSERAVEIHDAENLKRRILAGERLRVKFGMDPTAPDLHLGHLVVLEVLRRFQEAGHTAIALIGDYTALIGDPSGRSETRPMLSPEQVEANARTYLEQVNLVLDSNLTEVRRNSEWLGSMGAGDVLRLMGKATLQQVLQREDFAARLRSGTAIGAHEILYPFSQGYDSVALAADVEIGGTDQLFNLLFGREIQRAYGQRPQDVAVFPLLEGLDGVHKMSKSLGNHVGLTEPPEEIYGKLMSIPDGLIPRYLELVYRAVAGAPEAAAVAALPPRDAKAALARRIVSRLHGEEAARTAEADFDRKFRQRGVPERIPEVDVGGEGGLVGAIVELGFAPSRSQARRLIEQGGVRVNGKPVGLGHRLEPGDVLQIGKRQWAKIRTVQ